MKRGCRLEPEVLKIVSERLDMAFQRSGLICSPKHPIFGASPDAINGSFTVEIKCPLNGKTYFNYINKNGDMSPTYKAQVQLQMHLSGRRFGLFCVASPAFETNKMVKIMLVQYDEKYITEIMKKAEQFWKKAIGKFVVE